MSQSNGATTWRMPPQVSPEAPLLPPSTEQRSRASRRDPGQGVAESATSSGQSERRRGSNLEKGRGVDGRGGVDGGVSSLKRRNPQPPASAQGVGSGEVTGAQ